jgi:hypothetical protein
MELPILKEVVIILGLSLLIILALRRFKMPVINIMFGCKRIFLNFANPEPTVMSRK